MSFAYLVYSSAWLQVPLPGGVLRRAAGRPAHGVLVAPDHRGRRPPARGGRCCRPDVNLSAGDVACWRPARPAPGAPRCGMGISYVRGVGDAMAERIAAGRPYRDMEDLVRRTGVTRGPGRGAGDGRGVRGFGLSRRAALWSAGAVAAAGAGERGAGDGGAGAGTSGRGARSGPRPGHAGMRGAGPPGCRLRPAGDPEEPTVKARQGRLAGLVTGADAPPLPSMDPPEVNQADLWATGLSPDSYPTEFVRADLAAMGW